MSLSFFSSVYDLAVVVLAASVARVLVTPSVKLVSEPTDDDMDLMREITSGVAAILGLFIVWTNSPLVFIPLSLLTGAAVPMLLGLYLGARRLPEALKMWKQSCNATSDEILQGIKTGAYADQLQPKLAEVQDRVTTLVVKYVPQLQTSSEDSSVGIVAPSNQTAIAADASLAGSVEKTAVDPLVTAGSSSRPTKPQPKLQPKS